MNWGKVIDRLRKWAGKTEALISYYPHDFQKQQHLDEMVYLLRAAADALEAGNQ